VSDTERDRAFWQNPKADIADFMAFALGWSAAMKFMASPRIPAQPEYNCPPGGIPLPPEPARLPDGELLYGAELPEYLRQFPLPKEHNPHGLVAFYTDAPDV
jgi:hypothetical protein